MTPPMRRLATARRIKMSCLFVQRGEVVWLSVMVPACKAGVGGGTAIGREGSQGGRVHARNRLARSPTAAHRYPPQEGGEPTYRCLRVKQPRIRDKKPGKRDTRGVESHGARSLARRGANAAVGQINHVRFRVNPPPPIEGLTAEVTTTRSRSIMFFALGLPIHARDAPGRDGGPGARDAPTDPIRDNHEGRDARRTRRAGSPPGGDADRRDGLVRAPEPEAVSRGCAAATALRVPVRRSSARGDVPRARSGTRCGTTTL